MDSREIEGDRVMTGPIMVRVVQPPPMFTILSAGGFFLADTRCFTKTILVGIFSIMAALTDSAYSQVAPPDGPNVVLTQAAFFPIPGGEKVALTPGRYRVEAAGTTELRLTPMSGGKSTVLQAESLRHEQYELFSAFALTRPGAGGRVHISLLLPGGLQLEAVGETRQSPPQPKSQQSLAGRPATHQDEPVKKLAPLQLVYAPPRELSSGARVMKGATGADEKVPRIVPLAPDHVGLTTKEQPVLYWYLSQPLNDPVDIAFTVTGEPNPIFEARLVPPLEAGIQALNLGEFGVRLPFKVPYQWRVTCRCAGGTKELVGGGGILRIPVPDQLSADLVRARRGDFPHLYAQSGIWYDALAVVSDLIVTSPGDSALHQQRASLLEQVGFDDLARLDREAILISR